MRTQSLTKVNILRGMLFAVVLLLACTMSFIAGAGPSHAETADGGYTLTGQYISNEELSKYSDITNVTVMPEKYAPTTFKLYKVGSFISGEPYIKLDDPYDKMQIGDLPVDADQSDEITWTKEWLAFANTLSNYIPADAVPIEIDVDSSGHFSQSGLANGIYLLKGDSQLIQNYPENGKGTYWWPIPMLVSILNGDEAVTVKPMMEQVCQFRVHKVWENENGKQAKVRPSAIKVKIYFGTKDEAGLRFTEVLNAGNDWSFSWDAAKGEGDPSKWMVEETAADDSADKEKLGHYTVSIGSSFVKDDKGDIAFLTITNSFNPSESDTDEETQDQNHKTGDTFKPLKYILVMAAALLALLLLLFGRRKRKG